MESNVRQPSFTQEALDIENPSASNFFGEEPSRCFPCELFKCCPAGVKAFIPTTWTKIQDRTHLILVCGALACLALCVKTVIYLVNKGCFKFHCLQEVLAIVFILPCVTYCIRIIGQYDDRLTAKQRDAKQQKANLTRSYNDLLTDMDGLLTKSAESSAGLAERSFESKRRDFQRFLERAKNKYSSVYSGTKGDSDKLLMQFRRFCQNWLQVFEECSIDPVACPKRVVSSEELNRCTSIVDVADLCLDRLRVTEVRFISIQRDQDAQMLRRNRNEFRRLSKALTAPIDAAAVQRRPAPRPPSDTQRISWLELGMGHGFGMGGGSGEDPYPKEISFGCGRLILLSSEHLMLIVGFFMGWVIFALQVHELSTQNEPDDDSSVLAVLALITAEICVFTMLAKFEEIDVIQQLEREVKELTRQNEQVEGQRERMREFWSNAQQLTELWLYRTVPRLDLYKELHSLLEDTEEDLLMKISSANQHLEDLESTLGALQAWRSDGQLTIDEKKGFGKSINQLCQEQEFDELLVKLEEVTAKGMKSLQDVK